MNDAGNSIWLDPTLRLYSQLNYNVRFRQLPWFRPCSFEIVFVCLIHKTELLVHKTELLLLYTNTSMAVYSYLNNDDKFNKTAIYSITTVSSHTFIVIAKFDCSLWYSCYNVYNLMKKLNSLRLLQQGSHALKTLLF